MIPALPPLERSNRNHAFACALLAEICAAGVRNLCICPGSRSAPLAVAALEIPDLRRFVHVDEREAAFFALGLAKASREPVALLCTSGTAAANFLPAIVEADRACVPLIVLSADRPQELRDWGGPQTIDQVRLYGGYTRWFHDAPPPEPGIEALHYARALGSRAVAAASGALPGPVHLNLPFREPLDPRAVPEDFLGSSADSRAVHGRLGRAYCERWVPSAPPSKAQLERLVELARNSERVVLVCGPSDGGEELARAVARLARTAGWPVLAEATSQLRSGPHVSGAPIIGHAETILHDPAFAAAHVPDWILRVGGSPTGKATCAWISAHSATRISWLGRRAHWSDPDHRLSEVIDLDAPLVCDALEKALGEGPSLERESPWLRDFLAADRDAAQAVTRILSEQKPLCSPHIVRDVLEALPAHSTVFIGNSAVLRDVEATLTVSPKPLRMLTNRGASGIDGLLSSTLGAAAGSSEPVMLLIGDLAFLHGVGGLLAAARYDLCATIVVLDDDGGGIFSGLPIARFGEAVAFDELFRVRHGIDLTQLARAYGARSERVRNSGQLATALERARKSDGVSVIVVRIDPEPNRELRAKLAAAATCAQTPKALE